MFIAPSGGSWGRAPAAFEEGTPKRAWTHHQRCCAVGGEGVAEKHVGEKDVVAVKHANIVGDLETMNSSHLVLLLN